MKISFDGNRSGFSADLEAAVDRFLSAQPSGRTATAGVRLKAIALLCIAVLAYALLLADVVGRAGALGLAMLFGLASLLLLFNVGHDASHGAFSHSPRVNRWLSHVWDAIGISSRVWALRHNVAHHTFTNIVGTDLDIAQGFLLRLNPHERRRWFHRFQHVYAPLVYCGFSLYIILVRDFQLLAEPRFGNREMGRPSVRRYATAAAAKLAYLGDCVVAPTVVTRWSLLEVLTGFLLVHAVLGIVMAFVLAPTHITEGIAFEVPPPDGRISRPWADHQLVSAIDVAPYSRALGMLCGGLNMQIAHHLFPHVCHAHYRAITRIVEATARRWRLPYRSRPLLAAMRAHLSHLRTMGLAPQA
jgi:linoleoyl-CoA desaturase